MNKHELETICNDAANKIYDDQFTKEQMSKDMSKYLSSDGKTISNAGVASYCVNTSQEFTKKLLYSVLCEVLNINK